MCPAQGHFNMRLCFMALLSHNPWVMTDDIVPVWICTLCLCETQFYSFLSGTKSSLRVWEFLQAEQVSMWELNLKTDMSDVTSGWKPFRPGKEKPPKTQKVLPHTLLFVTSCNLWNFEPLCAAARCTLSSDDDSGWNPESNFPRFPWSIFGHRSPPEQQRRNYFQEASGKTQP